MKFTTPPTAPGSRYGRLVVLSEGETTVTASSKRLRRWRHWLCRCDCGNETTVLQERLRNGNTRSCGCLSHENRVRLAKVRTLIHGKWLTPEFKIWNGMLERCQNPNHAAFHRYGGRGIVVCEAWRGEFLAFFRDMGERPSPLHSLDRIDNDGPYSPENCRWATAAEQNRNRPDNRLVTFRGETLCVTDWARRIGITTPGLRQRLNAGWPIDRALTTPPKKLPGRPRKKQ